MKNRFIKKDKPAKEPTQQELQKRKKLVIFPLLIILFLASLYFIFKTSPEEEVRDKPGGFNIEIPLPSEDKIIEDKKAAYEHEQMQERKEQNLRTLQDFSFMLDRKPGINEADEDSMEITKPAYASVSYQGRGNNIHSSSAAYKDLSGQLYNFYQSSEEDREKQELEEKIKQLEERITAPQTVLTSTEEKLKLIEKTYEMAGKYMGDKETGNIPSGTKKVKTTPVTTVSEQVVSSLETPVTEEELLQKLSQPRNFGFSSVTDKSIQKKNTIRACVHSDQVIYNGQNVQLRLLQAMKCDDIVIPKNHILTGNARIQGERMQIDIISIEYNGIVMPVELMVYDSDGQPGINIPASMEREAATEALANTGTNIGSGSFSITQSAGQQIAMDLTRGVMQGGTQYISKKLRTTKITLKNNHRLLLFAKEE